MDETSLYIISIVLSIYLKSHCVDKPKNPFAG
jgi:hypothetical protein